MSILDFLFPKCCVGCQQIGSYFCPDCLPKLQRHTQICIVCRQFSINGQTHRHCQPYSQINQLIIACVYKEHLRKAIHQIKYRFAYDLVNEICSHLLLSTKIQQYMQESTIDLITDIPSHQHRSNFRGFNLPTLIATWLSQTYTLPYQTTLIKSKVTTPQVYLHRSDRFFNPQNSFQLSKPLPTNIKHILLVDDILTTGATLEAAAKALQVPSTVQISALTLASSH